MPLGISSAKAWLVGLELRVVGILKVVCVAIARGIFSPHPPRPFSPVKARGRRGAKHLALLGLPVCVAVLLFRSILFRGDFDDHWKGAFDGQLGVVVFERVLGGEFDHPSFVGYFAVAIEEAGVLLDLA
jgi:hypothetical protein